VLHRPSLFLGGEHAPALMTAIIAGGLAVSGMNTVSFVVGAAVWFGSIPLLRWMAKADPQMTKVYLRQLLYRGYYPARSRPWRTD
jgi:type IV secretion system protein TrbD